jgi:cyclohexa-1,5-dienecarbonyl-CoA hydratase
MSYQYVHLTVADGVARLTLDRPPVNVITIAVMRELRAALAEATSAPAVKLVTIEGAGDHFSYGASVEEHRPGAIALALAELRGTIEALLAVPAPTAAVVRGRCLGGGFELALACDLIFAAPTATLGLPEIALGLFPPAGAALLPVRVGATRAASAVLTGTASPASAWAAAGLIEVTASAPELEHAVDHWFDAHVASRSAAALRCAAVASRTGVRRQVDTVLPQLERLYLDTLMQTKDAVEGIEAFLAKRPPVWSDA